MSRKYACTYEQDSSDYLEVEQFARDERKLLFSEHNTSLNATGIVLDFVQVIDLRDTLNKWLGELPSLPPTGKITGTL